MKKKTSNKTNKNTSKNTIGIAMNDAKIKNPTLVVGLPGIGNVGKIVTDYVIERLNAKEIGRFYVDTPPMVFPTKNTVEFPSVKLYSAKSNGSNFLFIAGDYQPRESKCFEFCSQVIDTFKKHGGREIIILGGASLPEIGLNPSVYAITSREDLFDKYKKLEPSLKSAHGNLGPIVGVAGVLLGLAKDKGINATAFLTETTDNEYFSSRSVMKSLGLLNKLTGIKVNEKNFNSQLKNMGIEISSFKNLMKQEMQERGNDDRASVSYIG